MQESAAALSPALPDSGGHPVMAAIDAARRWAMIAEAAYYRSQQHSFTRSSELEDWLAAEAEVDRKLMGS